MKNLFNKDLLIKHWSSGKQLSYNGVKYRVGKMSYGDYFLEPGIPKGETEPFNSGTLWLQTVNGMPYFYEINRLLSFDK